MTATIKKTIISEFITSYSKLQRTLTVLVVILLPVIRLITPTAKNCNNDSMAAKVLNI